MGILDFLRRLAAGMPSREQGEERQRKRTKLLRLKGEQASTAHSRLTLYESGLRALMEGGGESSFIIFECKERDECYVQFAGGSADPSGLWGEVSGRPVSQREGPMLQDRGFAPPDGSDTNYCREFENANPHTVADLVEEVFTEVFHCPASYTAHVVNVVD